MFDSKLRRQSMDLEDLFHGLYIEPWIYLGVVY